MESGCTWAAGSKESFFCASANATLTLTNVLSCCGLSSGGQLQSFQLLLVYKVELRNRCRHCIRAIMPLDKGVVTSIIYLLNTVLAVYYSYGVGGSTAANLLVRPTH